MAAATPTPFANATTLAPQPQSRLADVMTPRGQHIPTWYDARTHADPANPGHINTQLFVKSRGIPLQAIDGEPFTIAEVPIERRWAVGADGEIIDQHVFQDQYVARIIEFYELAKRDNPKVSYTDDPRREPIPNVVHYVSEQVDPDDERRVMPMHYRNATAGAKPETLMGRDDQGETVEVPRLTALTAAYMDPSTRGAMRPEEIQEVEAEIQRMAQQATVVGEAREDSKRKRRGAPGLTTAPCGEKVPNLQGRRHRENCPQCQALE